MGRYTETAFLVIQLTGSCPCKLEGGESSNKIFPSQKITKMLKKQNNTTELYFYYICIIIYRIGNSCLVFPISIKMVTVTDKSTYGTTHILLKLVEVSGQQNLYSSGLQSPLVAEILQIPHKGDLLSPCRICSFISD